MAKTLKTLLPSLKERKRYLVFEVISKSKDFSLEDIKKSILDAEIFFLGLSGLSRAGLIFLEDWKNQRGIMRVSHKEVDAVKAGFCFVRKINKEEVVLRSIGVSGILQKARQLL